MSTATELNVYRDWLGIPETELPESGPPGHYALLRLVQFEDSEDKINNNYRKLNAHVRTYASGQFGPQSQVLLNELAKAKLCLTDPERKRDYDEAAGRVFEEAPGERVGMGAWLVRKKAISRDQLREAEAFAEARGLSLRDAVVQMKLVKPSVAAQALAEELGLGYIDLNETTPDDTVLDKLPRSTVKLNSVLPLFVDDDQILVACVHEPPHELDADLRLLYELPVRWVMTTPLAMNQSIAKYYAPGTRESAAALPSSGGKRGGKATAARVSFSQLSDGEKQQRKQLGIIIMCWAFIGTAMVDYFLVQPYVFPSSTWPFYLTFIVPPAVIYYVLKVYWK